MQETGVVPIAGGLVLSRMLPWTLFLKKKTLLGERPAGNGLGQDEKAEQSCGVTGM